MRFEPRAVQHRRHFAIFIRLCAYFFLRISEAALNLFINTNGQELLKEMKPSIKKHLLQTMRTFINNLFGRVPYEYWILDEERK